MTPSISFFHVQMSSISAADLRTACRRVHDGPARDHRSSLLCGTTEEDQISLLELMTTLWGLLWFVVGVASLREHT